MACSIMSISKNTFLFAVITIRLFLGNGESAVAPEDTEATTGANVTLYCRSSIAQIEWHHFPVGHSIHEIVYQDGFIFNGYKGRFNVIRDHNNDYNLMIKNVKATDAGKYTCVEKSEDVEQKTAELIVFEQYPSIKFCAAKFTCAPDCDALELTCRMKAHGNIIPSMEWRESANGILTSNSNIENEISTSSIHLQPNNNAAQSYSCRVKYATDSLVATKFIWSYSISAPASLADEKLQVQSNTKVFIAIIALMAATIVGMTAAILVQFFKNKRRKEKFDNSMKSRNADHSCSSKESENGLQSESRRLLDPEVISPSFEGFKNAVILSGNNVSMSCKPNSSDSPVTWYHIRTHSGSVSTQVRLINTGDVPHRGFSEYSFGGIAPGEVLSLNDTQLSHAGLYRCSTEGQQATAQLIVIASQPNCSFTFDQSHLLLVCIVNHSGYWIPSMRWFMTTATDDARLKTISESNCSSASYSDGTSKISVANFTSLTSESVIVFKFNFSNRFCSKANSTATNVPGYEFTWRLSISQIINNLQNDFMMGESTSLSTLTRYADDSENKRRSDNNLSVVLTLASALFVLLIVFASITFIRMTKATRNNSRVLPSENDSEMIPTQCDRHEDPKNSFSASSNKWPDSKCSGLSRTLSDDLEAAAHYAVVDRSDNRHQYIGADGTVYLNLKGLSSGSQMPSAPLSSNKHQEFNRSEYASIDHCLTAPPAPPR